MSKEVAISFAIGAALSGSFQSAFNNAGRAMAELHDKSSALSKAAGQVGDYQKLQQSIKTNQAAMLAMRNQAGQLGQQMKDTAAQTAALKTQFNAAQAEASKMGTAHQRSKESYQAVSAQVKELREQMKAVPSDELRQKLSAAQAEARKLKGTVAQDSAQFKAASAHVKELGRQLKGSTDKEKAMSRESANLSAKADTLQGKLDRDREALSQLRSSLTAAGVDMKNLASEHARLTSESDRLAAAQNRLQDAQAKYSAAKQRLSWGNIKGELMTAAGLGMALKVPVTVAVNFEQAMSGVEAVSFAGKANTDEQKAEFAELRNQALKLGSTTQFTAMQAAQSQENLARAGFTSSQILNAMPGLLDMAAAEGMDLAQAADIVASGLKGFNLKADQAGRIADGLAMVSAASNTNISELGEAMKYAAPMAAGLGISFEETISMFGIMANAGIKASQAGTAFRGAFGRLAQQPEAVANALKKLNIPLLTQEGDMRKTPGLMKDLSKAMKGMGNAQKEGLLIKIFGKNAISGMQALLNNVDTKEWEKLEKKVLEADRKDVAHAMAKARTDNLAGDLTALSSAWEGLNVSIGDNFLPVARLGVEALTGIISAVTTLTREFPVMTNAISGGLATLAVFRIGKTLSGIVRDLIALPGLLRNVNEAQAAVQGIAATASAGTAAGASSGIAGAGVGKLGLGGFLKTAGLPAFLAFMGAEWLNRNMDKRPEMRETLSERRGMGLNETGLSLETAKKRYEMGLGSIPPDLANMQRDKFADEMMKLAQRMNINVQREEVLKQGFQMMSAMKRYAPSRAHLSEDLLKLVDAAKEAQVSGFVDAVMPAVNELNAQQKLGVKRDDVVQYGQQLIDGLRGNEQAILALPENLRPVLEMLKANPVIMQSGAVDVVPHALGGIFSSPHIGLIAEDGDEAVLPLENRSRGIPLWLAAGERMGLKFGGGGGESTTNNSYVGGPPTINITVSGGNGEPGLAQRIAQAVRDVLSDIQSYEERVAFA